MLCSFAACWLKPRRFVLTLLAIQIGWDVVSVVFSNQGLHCGGGIKRSLQARPTALQATGARAVKLHLGRCHLANWLVACGRSSA
jgi:hypothetical protein